MVPPPAAAARRLRLNVATFLGTEVASKFLVVVDAEAQLDELVSKVERALKRQNGQFKLEQIVNGAGAVLPPDEELGVLFRDGEDVHVLLRGGGSKSLQKTRSPSTVGECSESTMLPVGASTASWAKDTLPTVTLQGTRGESGSIAIKGVISLPPDDDDDDDPDDEDEKTRGPEAGASATLGEALRAVPGVEAVPGPSEVFEADCTAPREVIHVEQPWEPVQLTSYDNDWLVESLPPRLKEHVMANFQEDCITEPKYVPSIKKFVAARFLQTSGSFVSVFMRPQTAIGSDPSATMPVHYNVAKTEIATFQRRCEEQVQKAQQHAQLFRQTLHALKALLARGMSASDQINVMLPHSYEAFTEIEGTMMEAERSIFPDLRGSRTVVIVDTSGAAGKHLAFMKGALKLALHSQLAGKSSFQLIRFAPTSGEPRMFAQKMAPPTEKALQSAEEWIDGLSAASSRGFYNAFQCALAQDTDEVVLLSSADIEQAQHEDLLHSIRSLNTSEVPIHTVGVEPTPLGELLLRNIAESNHGDFALRSFDPKQQSRETVYPAHDAQWVSWRTNLVNEKSKQLSESFKKQRMTIGSQIRILEVMQREEAQKEQRWRDEWICAQRLLTSGEAQKSFTAPDRDAVKEMERKSTRTLSARVGGGYMYQTDEFNLGLEKLFEQASAVPWTQNSETVATGPKTPVPRTLGGEPGACRAPRLPPQVNQVVPMPIAPDAPSARHAPAPLSSSGTLSGTWNLASQSMEGPPVAATPQADQRRGRRAASARAATAAGAAVQLRRAARRPPTPSGSGGQRGGSKKGSTGGGGGGSAVAAPLDVTQRPRSRSGRSSNAAVREASADRAAGVSKAARPPSTETVAAQSSRGEEAQDADAAATASERPERRHSF